MKKRKLPTEEEIINRIEADWSKPKVTFLSTTYNQQDYIADTIEGFLIQKTSFPYEIIIHDDCSTDKTRKVIDSYKAKYPNLIRTIYQKQNQYSQGVPVTLIAAKEARAEYIALCEGDDYWINENKIENQLNLMLDDPSITMVVSPGKPRRNEKVFNKVIGYHGDNVKQISAQYLLNCTSGSLAPTASYIVKKKYLIDSRTFFKDAPVGDLFIELYNAVFGKLVYYPEIMTVYRLMAKNSWSQKMSQDKLNNLLKFISSMECTISNSKTIVGFEDLDWSLKLSLLYLYLAIEYLRMAQYSHFKETITLSYKHKKLNNTQFILYRARKSRLMLIQLRLLLGLRNQIKRFR